MRLQAQQQYLRQNPMGGMPGNMQYNMMRMNGGMPMNANETRQRALQNNLRNM